jgi:hypothetical protein
MNYCDKNDCKMTPQLCVDASIFVPEDECVCYATGILFDGMTLDKNTRIPEIPGGSLSTVAVVPSSITFSGSLALGADAVAIITVTASNSPDLSSIVISNPTITGLNVAFSGPNIFLLTNDPLSCFVSLLRGNCNFAITPAAGNPPMTFHDNAPSPQGPYVFDIRFFGVLIGQFKFTMFQPTPTTWSFDALMIDNLSSYPGTGIDHPPFNNDAVEVRCINDTAIDIDNTQAENIGAAAIVLNLKANSNVIGPYDGTNLLKRGIYRLCIAYKPWNIGYASIKWEIREIVEFVLCDDKLKAYWGCSTSKAGQRIRGYEDRATLTVGNLEIQAAGNPSDVFRNINDFALTIRNVFQTFSAVGPLGSLDSLVVSSVLNATVPYPPTTLIPNIIINNIVAKMANSRLYVALKYDCPNSQQYCPDPQNLNDFRHSAKNCKIGSLSPFRNKGGDCVKNNQTVTSIFINKELTNLQDHLFQNSHLSREATVCLTPDCLNKVICSKTNCDCHRCKPQSGGCGQKYGLLAHKSKKCNCNKLLDVESTASSITKSKDHSQHQPQPQPQPIIAQSSASSESSWPLIEKQQSNKESDSDEGEGEGEVECKCGKKNCNKCNKKRYYGYNKQQNNNNNNKGGCKSCK